MDTKKRGDEGETIACGYLVKKGFKILVRNYRISFGEIDIIAKKRWGFLFGDKTIHFVEVKTLADQQNNFNPEEHVDAKKKNKLRQMAEIWLEKKRFKQPQPYQIDIIGISIDQNTNKARISYFENIIEGV